MRAAVVITPGEPEAITVIDVPVPEPGVGELRVEVAAAGVNPVDLGTRAGFFHGLGLVHQPDHTGLGWDVAGTVVATGPGVDLPDRHPRRRDRAGLRPAARDVRRAGRRCARRPSPSYPTDSTWSRRPPCRSTASPPPRRSTCSARPRAARLLVTGAAGAVGGFALRLAVASGWSVTGLARAEDEDFVREHRRPLRARADRGLRRRLDAARTRGRGDRAGPRRRLVRRPPPGRRSHAGAGHHHRGGRHDPEPTCSQTCWPVRRPGELPARVHAVLPAGPGRRRPPRAGEGWGARPLRAAPLTRISR